MNNSNDFRSIFSNATSDDNTVNNTPEEPSVPSYEVPSQPYQAAPVNTYTANTYTANPITPTVEDNDMEIPQMREEPVIPTDSFQPSVVKSEIQQPEVIETSIVDKFKEKKMIIAIVVGVIVFGVFLFALAGTLKRTVFNNHKNTTGGNYANNDVTYNCSYTKTENNNQINASADILFNYKNYQVQIFNKMVITVEGLSDEKYENFVKNIYGLCVVDNQCTSNDIDAGITSYGTDTHIKRSGNDVIVTYTTLAGLGQTANDSDKASVKASLEKQGMTCK